MIQVKKHWKSKTSKLVQFLQKLLVSVGAGALAYTQMPITWQTFIPEIIIKISALTGFVLPIFLQFTSKKSKP